MNRDAETTPNYHETPDEAELRRLAEAATPGPWSLTDGDPAMNGQHWTIRRQGVAGIRVSGFTYGFNGDAAYIAAANPAAVLALLDDLDAARAAITRVQGLHGAYTETWGDFGEHSQTWCAICDGEPYPCPTIRALDGDAEEGATP